MNLYCRLIEHDKSSALYAVGESCHELDGLVRFFTDDTAPIIEKPWSGHHTELNYRIYSINRKYRHALSSANFPQKMAREIG